MPAAPIGAAMNKIDFLPIFQLNLGFRVLGCADLGKRMQISRAQLSV